MKVAVVADVHLHDLFGGYGMLKERSGAVALRTFADTMASTRVFNESHAAFLAVLDDIVRRGIRDVVLLGDYSDDGQPGAVDALKAILTSYEDRYRLRFFAAFGNHDCFGPAGRHQCKLLTRSDGLGARIVTSDETAVAPAIARSQMQGMSTADAMHAMSSYGIARPADVLQWETPFGARDGLGQRYPEGGNPAGLDASYLVEPQPGLWLLILDANVFDAVDGGWQVRSNAAWDHVLAHRPYLLPWIGDIARRAVRLDKTLLAFSHYPALPLTLAAKGGTVHAVGTREWLTRMPSLDTGRLLAAHGIRWHFSGHMHVAGRSELDGLVNIAVPSPVAYPGGYVVVDVEDGETRVETLACLDTPGFDIAFAAYDRQQRGTPSMPHASVLRECKTYHAFLHAHLCHLVANRHVARDYPADLLGIIDRPIGDFLDDKVRFEVAGAGSGAASLPLRVMLKDYYLLRSDGGEGRDVPADRMVLYRELGRLAANTERPNGWSSSKLLTAIIEALVQIIRAPMTI